MGNPIGERPSADITIFCMPRLSEDGLDPKSYVIVGAP